MMEQTIKCKICGEPYIFYAHMAGDQSACPKCIMKARKNYEWVPNIKTPPLNVKCLHVGQEVCYCTVYGE